MKIQLGPGKGVECPTPKQIVSELVESYPDLGLFCSFSTAIYDSAWLSMVYKHDGPSEDETPLLLFPECLSFILKEQNEDGGWECYGSQFDGILNSLAALLALATYRRKHGTQFESLDLEQRIESAQAHIQSRLDGWDVESCVQVGFEVLVTGILTQLQAFDITFDFAGLLRVKKLYGQKMKQFVPQIIYSKKQTTILHSLEALVGVIDFDRVSHHCTEKTGILASPSATAAYLIHATKWDEKAERYLRAVLQAYGTDGFRGVPSAFPTPVFELTWTLSSILSSTVDMDGLDPNAVSQIAAFLTETLQINGGTAGFAPGLLSDADDTARTVMTLQLLGKSPDAGPMIAQFEEKTHFRTYEMERNPSYSANCNVLLALLYLDNVSAYVSQVSKALEFMLQEFENSEVLDKWNVSPQYCGMLSVQAFVKILELYDSGLLQSLGEEVVTERIPIAICRILLRTLAAQNADGDWNGNLEETSYSVLIIAQCLRLRWNRSAKNRLEDSLNRGKQYLRTQYPHKQESHYFWVEKTTYETALLKMAYCSIAIHSKSCERKWTAETFFIPEAQSKKMAYLFSALPIFSDACLSAVDIILVEASHLTRFLLRVRQKVFSRDEIPMSKDKYLGFIPAIWTMCNYMENYALSVNEVREMVWLSLLNYQADEFMETIVGEMGSEMTAALIQALQEEFATGEQSAQLSSNGVDTNGDTGSEPASKKRKLENGNGHHSNGRNGAVSASPSVKSVLSTLRKYIAHVRSHAAVTAAPGRVQRSLANELHTFLLAHITHNADNVVFRDSRLRNGGKGFTCTDLGRSSYLKWIHSTGADDTSCPFSFQFFACLVSHTGAGAPSKKKSGMPDKYCFEGAQAGYFAHTLARRLAVMCRMYNDLGSVARDAEEGNLNSLDFDEFHRDGSDSANGGGSHTTATTNGNGTVQANGHGNGDAPQERMAEVTVERKKDDLMAVAEFEREGMMLAMKSLENVVDEVSVMKKLKVFVDVTDTFGLIYVQKDLASSRLK